MLHCSHIPVTEKFDFIPGELYTLKPNHTLAYIKRNCWMVLDLYNTADTGDPRDYDDKTVMMFLDLKFVNLLVECRFLTSNNILTVLVPETDTNFILRIVNK